ncbi:MAG: GlsB/YeaQ/YmgE family stress response membrane protein [Patescibacteria group bacterium]
MNILLWIVFGALVGWIASKVMHTDAQQGLVMNVVVGIIGAFLGGWIFQSFGSSGAVTGFNLYSFIVALVGAIVLIWIVKMIRR